MLKGFKFRSLARRLTDIRVVGQITLGIIVLMISWSGVKAIMLNHDLQQEIEVLEQEVNIADLENENLALQNEYLETDEYLEIAARESLGKAAKGETVYVIPNDVAMKNAPEIEPISDENVVKTTSSEGNIHDWIDFFFR